MLCSSVSMCLVIVRIACPRLERSPQPGQLSEATCACTFGFNGLLSKQFDKRAVPVSPEGPPAAHSRHRPSRAHLRLE